MPQTRPPFLGFTQFVHPSRCSRSLTTVCVCSCLFSVSVSEQVFEHHEGPDQSRCVFMPSLCSYVPSLHICKCVHDQSLQTLRQIHHRLVTIMLKWSVGSMACGIPILRLEQFCGTEATIDFVLRIVATFARFFSFLMLTSSSRTCFGTQKLSRISVFSLLSCFQSIRQRILHFSNIQCCHFLNRRFRFQSVVPKSALPNLAG